MASCFESHRFGICTHQIFTAPSFDDKILEVVAVFGSVQMAVTRFIDIQRHRIAQVNTLIGLDNYMYIYIFTPSLSMTIFEIKSWSLCNINVVNCVALVSKVVIWNLELFQVIYLYETLTKLN